MNPYIISKTSNTIGYSNQTFIFVRSKAIYSTSATQILEFATNSFERSGLIRFVTAQGHPGDSSGDKLNIHTLEILFLGLFEIMKPFSH